MSAAAPRGQWVSVDERLPGFLEEVLICARRPAGEWLLHADSPGSGDPFIVVGFRAPGARCDRVEEWHWQSRNDAFTSLDLVTHWMPKPAPPEPAPSPTARIRAESSSRR
jgi:hypothetical protein